MEVLMNTTVLFALGLTLSLIVERILEILKAAYDIFDSRLDWHRHWTRQARRIKKKLERRLRIFEYVSPEQANAVLRAAHEVVLGPRNGYQGTVPAVSGDLVRAMWVKMVAKFIGVVIGIALAFYFQIDFISLWKTVYANLGAGADDIAAMSVKVNATPLGMTLTGIAIGLGSAPVHKIITAMERSWELKKMRQGRGQ